MEIATATECRSAPVSISKRWGFSSLLGYRKNPCHLPNDGIMTSSPLSAKSAKLHNNFGAARTIQPC